MWLIRASLGWSTKNMDRNTISFAFGYFNFLVSKVKCKNYWQRFTSINFSYFFVNRGKKRDKFIFIYVFQIVWACLIVSLTSAWTFFFSYDKNQFWLCILLWFLEGNKNSWVVTASSPYNKFSHPHTSLCLLHIWDSLPLAIIDKWRASLQASWWSVVNESFHERF